MAINVDAAIRVELTGYQQSINKLKSTIENIDPSSTLGRKLNQQLAQAENRAIKLQAALGKGIDSSSGVNSIITQMRGLDSIIQQIGIRMQQVTQGDININPQIQQIQTLENELQNIVTQYDALAISAVTSSQEFRKVASTLGIDENFVETRGLEALSGRINEFVNSNTQRLQEFVDTKNRLERELSNMSPDGGTTFTSSDAFKGIMSIKESDFNGVINGLRNVKLSADQLTTVDTGKIQNVLSQIFDSSGSGSSGLSLRTVSQNLSTAYGAGESFGEEYWKKQQGVLYSILMGGDDKDRQRSYEWGKNQKMDDLIQPILNQLSNFSAEEITKRFDQIRQEIRAHYEAGIEAIDNEIKNYNNLMAQKGRAEDVERTFGYIKDKGISGEGSYASQEGALRGVIDTSNWIETPPNEKNLWHSFLEAMQMTEKDAKQNIKKTIDDFISYVKEQSDYLNGEYEKSLQAFRVDNPIIGRLLENKDTQEYDAVMQALSTRKNALSAHVNELSTPIGQETFISPQEIATALRAAFETALGILKNDASIQNILGEVLSNIGANGTSGIEQAKNQLVQRLQQLRTDGVNELSQTATAYKAKQQEIAEAIQKISEISDVKNFSQFVGGVQNGTVAPTQEMTDLLARYNQLQTRVQELEQEIINLRNGNAGQGVVKNIKDSGKNDVKPETESFNRATAYAKNYKNELDQINSKQQRIGQIRSLILQWMGIYAVIRNVRQAINSIKTTISDLDKAITNISIVSGIDSSKLWGQIGEYTKLAQQYGTTIKGVYEVSQLYYQQGLSTNEVTSMTAQTLKLARISGLEYSTATDYMTNAMRSFKIETSDANVVTDVFSNLAANSASSVSELSESMSKAATTMESVGASFQNTSAFIAMMLETTRESSSTIGVAMSSIGSRYGKITQDPNGEGARDEETGEVTTLNDVDEALTSVGINMKDEVGQIRNMDEVVLELAEKWATLDRNTQAYLATQMAGTRQRSRFLALMSDYDRLTQLVAKAENSENAAQLQLIRSMDSLETKANKVSNAMKTLYTGLHFEDVGKGFLDFEYNLLDSFNNMDWFSKVNNAVTIIASITTSVKTLFSVISAHVKTAAEEAKMAASGTTTQAQAEVQKVGNKIRTEIPEAARQGSAQASQEISNGLNGRKWSLKDNMTNPMYASVASGLMMAGTSAQIASMGMDDATEAMRGAKAGMAGLGATAQTLGFAMSGNLVMAVWSAVTGFKNVFDTLDYTIDERIADLEKKKEKANNEYLVADNEADKLEETIAQLKKLSEARYESEEANKKYIDYCNQVADSYPELVNAFDAEGNAVIDLADAYEELAAKREEAANKKVVDSEVSVAQSLALARKMQEGNDRAESTMNGATSNTVYSKGTGDDRQFYVFSNGGFVDEEGTKYSIDDIIYNDDYKEVSGSDYNTDLFKNFDNSALRLNYITSIQDRLKAINKDGIAQNIQDLIEKYDYVLTDEKLGTEGLESLATIIDNAVSALEAYDSVVSPENIDKNLDALMRSKIVQGQTSQHNAISGELYDNQKLQEVLLNAVKNSGTYSTMGEDELYSVGVDDEIVLNPMIQSLLIVFGDKLNDVYKDYTDEQRTQLVSLLTNMQSYGSEEDLRIALGDLGINGELQQAFVDSYTKEIKALQERYVDFVNVKLANYESKINESDFDELSNIDNFEINSQYFDDLRTDVSEGLNMIDNGLYVSGKAVVEDYVTAWKAVGGTDDAHLTAQKWLSEANFATSAGRAAAMESLEEMQRTGKITPELFEDLSKIVGNFNDDYVSNYATAKDNMNNAVDKAEKALDETKSGLTYKKAAGAFGKLNSLTPEKLKFSDVYTESENGNKYDLTVKGIIIARQQVNKSLEQQSDEDVQNLETQVKELNALKEWINGINKQEGVRNSIYDVIQQYVLDKEDLIARMSDDEAINIYNSRTGNNTKDAAEAREALKNDATYKPKEQVDWEKFTEETGITLDVQTQELLENIYQTSETEKDFLKAVENTIENDNEAIEYIKKLYETAGLDWQDEQKKSALKKIKFKKIGSTNGDASKKQIEAIASYLAADGQYEDSEMAMEAAEGIFTAFEKGGADAVKALKDNFSEDDYTTEDVQSLYNNAKNAMNDALSDLTGKGGIVLSPATQEIYREAGILEDVAEEVDGTWITKDIEKDELEEAASKMAEFVGNFANYTIEESNDAVTKLLSEQFGKNNSVKSFINSASSGNIKLDELSSFLTSMGKDISTFIDSQTGEVADEYSEFLKSKGDGTYDVDLTKFDLFISTLESRFGVEIDKTADWYISAINSAKTTVSPEEALSSIATSLDNVSYEALKKLGDVFGIDDTQWVADFFDAELQSDGSYKMSTASLGKMIKVFKNLGYEITDKMMENFVKQIDEDMGNIASIISGATSGVSSMSDAQKLIAKINELTGEETVSYDDFSYDEELNAWVLSNEKIAQAIKQQQEEISTALRNAGWTEEQIAKYLEENATKELQSYLGKIDISSFIKDKSKEKDLRKQIDNYINAAKALGIEVEYTSDDLVEKISNGGKDAVWAVNELNRLQGKETSVADVREAYQAQITQLENIKEELGYTVNSIVSADTARILNDVDGYEVVEIEGTGAYLINSVGDLGQALLTYYQKLKATNEATTSELNDAAANWIAQINSKEYSVNEFITSKSTGFSVNDLKDLGNAFDFEIMQFFDRRTGEVKKEFQNAFNYDSTSGQYYITDWNSFISQIESTTKQVVDKTSTDYLEAYQKWAEDVITKRISDGEPFEDIYFDMSQYVDGTNAGYYLQDALDDAVDDYIDQLENAIGGTASGADAVSIADAFDLDLETSFDRTAEGLRITREAAMQVYNQVNAIDPSKALSVMQEIVENYDKLSYQGSTRTSHIGMAGRNIGTSEENLDKYLDWDTTKVTYVKQNVKEIKADTDSASASAGKLSATMGNASSEAGKLQQATIGVRTASQDAANAAQQIESAEKNATSSASGLQTELSGAGSKVEYIKKVTVEHHHEQMKTINFAQEFTAELKSQIQEMENLGGAIGNAEERYANFQGQISEMNNPDSYKFTETPLPDSMQAAMNAWQSGATWMDKINNAFNKSSSSYGQIDFTDFKNMIDFAAETAEQAGMRFEVGGMNAAQLIEAGANALKGVDGNVVVDINKLGIDVTAAADGLTGGVTNAINTIAAQNLKIIDDLIGFLEVVVKTQEMLEAIDMDEDNEFDLSELFPNIDATVSDEERFQINEKLKPIIDADEDLQNGLKNIQLGKATLYDYLTGEVQVTSREQAQALTELMNYFLESYDSIDWNDEADIEKLMENLDEWLSGLGISIEEAFGTFSVQIGNSINSKNWKFVFNYDALSKAVKDFLKDHDLGSTQQEVKDTIIDYFNKLNKNEGDSITLEESIGVQMALGNIDIETDKNGDMYYVYKGKKYKVGSEENDLREAMQADVRKTIEEKGDVLTGKSTTSSTGSDGTTTTTQTYKYKTRAGAEYEIDFDENGTETYRVSYDGQTYEGNTWDSVMKKVREAYREKNMIADGSYDSNGNAHMIDSGKTDKEIDVELGFAAKISVSVDTVSSGDESVRTAALEISKWSPDRLQKALDDLRKGKTTPDVQYLLRVGYEYGDDETTDGVKAIIDGVGVETRTMDLVIRATVVDSTGSGYNLVDLLDPNNTARKQIPIIFSGTTENITPELLELLKDNNVKDEQIDLICRGEYESLPQWIIDLLEENGVEVGVTTTTTTDENLDEVFEKGEEGVEVGVSIVEKVKDFGSGVSSIFKKIFGKEGTSDETIDASIAYTESVPATAGSLFAAANSGATALPDMTANVTFASTIPSSNALLTKISEGKLILPEMTQNVKVVQKAGLGYGAILRNANNGVRVLPAMTQDVTINESRDTTSVGNTVTEVTDTVKSSITNTVSTSNVVDTSGFQASMADIQNALNGLDTSSFKEKIADLLSNINMPSYSGSATVDVGVNVSGPTSVDVDTSGLRNASGAIAGGFSSMQSGLATLRTALSNTGSVAKTMSGTSYLGALKTAIGNLSNAKSTSSGIGDLANAIKKVKDSATSSVSSSVSNLASAIGKIPSGKDKYVSELATAMSKIQPRKLTVQIVVQVTGASGASKGNVNVSHLMTGTGWSGRQNTATLDLTKAKGNVALASGTRTLMGELGPELVVSNGQYFTVGNNGPEFVNLASDAIVFNHLQTKQLLNGGKTHSYGRPHKNERAAVAFAGGNVSGPALANAAQALAALKELRAMWASLASAGSEQLGRTAGTPKSGKSTTPKEKTKKDPKEKTKKDPKEKGGGGGDKEKIPYAFLHDLDRWYNLEKQIERLEADINLLEKERANLIHSITADGKLYAKNLLDSSKLLSQQIEKTKQLKELTQDYLEQRAEDLETDTLYGKILYYNEDYATTQYTDAGFLLLADLQEATPNGTAMRDSVEQLALLRERLIKMAEVDMDSAAAIKYVDNYINNILRYDDTGKDVTVDDSGKALTAAEISESKLKNFYSALDSWKAELESYVSSVNEYSQKLEELQSNLNSIVEKVIENQKNVENLLLTALTDNLQTSIDKLQDSMDALTKANEDYANNLKDSLEKEKNMYEQQKNQGELTKLQRQLAILQRTGGSASQIKQLQDQISSQLREDYFSTQESEIEKLQEAAEEQTKKMQTQIDIMTESLEYQKENGLLWQKVYEMMEKQDAAWLADYIQVNTKEYLSKSPLENSTTFNENYVATQLFKQLSELSGQMANQIFELANTSANKKSIQRLNAIAANEALDNMGLLFEEEDSAAWEAFEKAFDERYNGKYGTNVTSSAKANDTKVSSLISTIKSKISDSSENGAGKKIKEEALKYLNSFSSSHKLSSAEIQKVAQLLNDSYIKYTADNWEKQYIDNNSAYAEAVRKYEAQQIIYDYFENADSVISATGADLENITALAQKINSSLVDENGNAIKSGENDTTLVSGFHKDANGDITELKINVSPEFGRDYEAYIKKPENGFFGLDDAALEALLSSLNIKAYKRGGLVDFTGPAWVDGTKSKPEAFLSASDTALLRSKLFSNSEYSLKSTVESISALAEQLSNINTTKNESALSFGDVTINIASGTISDDYDAQRAGQNVIDEMMRIARKNSSLSIRR